VSETHPGAFRVPFVKASACGNDFLLVEERFAPVDLADFTRRACDRHNGVGADGVEWLAADDDADIAARLLNADGSAAEVSGNGTRCVAALVASAHTEHDTFTVRTGAGIRICQLVSRRDPEFEFDVDMWAPLLGEPEKLQLSVGSVTGRAVSVGNPHFVVLVDRFERGWQAMAAELETHPRFPERTNVELVRVVGEGEVDVRFYERGVGETRSSGTGSVAAAVAAVAAGRARSPVRVLAPGGAQTVIWDGAVTLRGTARLVCAGSFYL
jgi:diaminopimelate epimerase